MFWIVEYKEDEFTTGAFIELFDDLFLADAYAKAAKKAYDDNKLGGPWTCEGYYQVREVREINKKFV